MALKISSLLFYELEKNSLRYCHWKSNQHLQEALNGLTDIDLLIDREQAQQCENLLKKLGFIRITSIRDSYPGIFDWLGFDEKTGSLIHLHLHYNLIFGEKNIKSIHMPVEKWLLENTILYEGIRIPAHECELLLLIIRSVIKTDTYDIIKAIKNKKMASLPGDVNKEFDWLLERCNINNLTPMLAKSGIPIEEKVLLQFIDLYKNNTLSVNYLIKTKWLLLSRLKPYARYSRIQYLYKKAIIISQRLPLLKFFKRKQKKVLADHLLYFALVGADGSGKTRLVGDLKKWLGWKLEVKYVYFGIPKRSYLRRGILKLADVFRYFNKSSRRKNGLSRLSSYFAKCADLLESLSWLYVARTRLAKNRKALELAKSGQVIIAERFPMLEFWDMKKPMDGPRITELNILLRRLAGYEREVYKQILTPDLLFVLEVGIDELRSRKNDLPFDVHLEKCEAVELVSVKGSFRTVNAEMDYERVLLKIKSGIWSFLQGQELTTKGTVNKDEAY